MADHEKLSYRFIQILRMLDAFINGKKLVNCVQVDYEILKKALHDYFVDVERIKKFHPINKINVQKIYGYTAYWLNMRKPIQVIKPFKNHEFINERFITGYLVSNIISEQKIKADNITTNKAFQDFQGLLFYNLKYRPISQQSLELMIEAFFCGNSFP
jgi:hypothetical protein